MFVEKLNTTCVPRATGGAPRLWRCARCDPGRWRRRHRVPASAWNSLLPRQCKLLMDHCRQRDEGTWLTIYAATTMVSTQTPVMFQICLPLICDLPCFTVVAYVIHLCQLRFTQRACFNPNDGWCWNCQQLTNLLVMIFRCLDYRCPAAATVSADIAAVARIIVIAAFVVVAVAVAAAKLIKLLIALLMQRLSFASLEGDMLTSVLLSSLVSTSAQWKAGKCS